MDLKLLEIIYENVVKKHNPPEWSIKNTVLYESDATILRNFRKNGEGTPKEKIMKALLKNCGHIGVFIKEEALGKEWKQALAFHKK